MLEATRIFRFLTSGNYDNFSGAVPLSLDKLFGIFFIIIRNIREFFNSPVKNHSSCERKNKITLYELLINIFIIIICIIITAKEIS